MSSSVEKEMSILLISTNQQRLDSAYKIYDGELLYLGQHLFDNSFKSISLINIKEIDLNSDHNVLILNLSSSELLIQSRIESILITILEYKRKYNSYVIAIGSIASLLRNEIFCYNLSIDTIIDINRCYYRDNYVHFHIKDINNIIRMYFDIFVKLTEEYIKKYFHDLTIDDVFSLYSSRGCVNRCSFCAYNANYTSLKERKIEDLLSDISILSNIGISKVALFDNNFGLSIDSNIIRSKELSNYITSRNLNVRLSLNVSFSCIDRSVIDNLHASRVAAILLGLESFNKNTLVDIYNKKQNIDTCIDIVNYIENKGITPVVSYILFHPWLTLEDLRNEVEMIDMFGRHRIVQFFCNSKLYVVPNTMIEKKLIGENLLKRKNLFNTDFHFKDSRVEDIYLTLKKFYIENFKYSDSTYIEALKKREFELLKSII